MITADREVSFDVTLRHLETDEPIEVLIHATIEGMDRHDLDQYYWEDAIRDAAFEVDQECSP